MNLHNQNIHILFVSCKQEDVIFAVKEIGKEVSNVNYTEVSTENNLTKAVSDFTPEIVIADCSRLSYSLFNLLEITRLVPAPVPVILLAGNDSEEMAVEGLKAGAFDYILKGQMKRLPFAVANVLANLQSKALQLDAEKKLEGLKEIYLKNTEILTEAVFLIKNQELLYINPEFESIFELSAKDILHKKINIIDLAAPEHRPYVEEKYKKVILEENVKHHFEFTSITGSGIRKEVDATISYNRINGDEIIQGKIIDITKGKDIEKSLLESERKFRRIFYNHSAIKLIVDPDTGRILDANLAAAAFYGWSVEELQQMNVSEIIFLPPRDVARAQGMNNLRKNAFFEVKHLNARGEVVDVEIFSSTVEYEGIDALHFIIHDITSRKKAEHKLHLLNHAVEQNPAAIVITNPDGIIDYVNPEFTSMTGYEMNEIVGQSFRLLKSGYQSEDFYKNLWNTITSGRNWEGEFKNRKKNGELYWQDSIISPILDEYGSISHYVAVLEDITEKKRMIGDLVKAKEKAEESDRLKSSFLANMSHEIRTPMNGIIGFTDLLKEQKLTGTEKDAYINIIKKSGERMLGTINDLIELSQIESGSIELKSIDVNINDLMKSYFHQFVSEANAKGLELNCHKGLTNSHAILHTDVKKLNAIFQNLLKNALKYTPAGEIEFGYMLKDNMIEFFVSDTGIGIERDRQKIIFDRFVQADMSMTKPYEGAGLGLSIAKSYVDILGGKIRVDSAPGEGARFYFSIPYHGKSMLMFDEMQVKRKASGTDLLKNLNILVAEDDVVGKLYISELLDNECRQVWYASDGLEAVEFFENNHQNIDVVLMDIKMPGIDGYEATKKMKEIDNNVVIIAQTAYALAGDKEKAFRSGCDFYISKPFSKAQLVDAIEKVYC